MRSNRRPKNNDEPKIFGRGPQDRYLVGIATHGPIRARKLGRLMGIDAGRLPNLRREFCDVVTLDDDGRLRLNEASVIHDEIAAVLHHLAGNRFFVLRPPAQPGPPLRRLDLFGGALRTRILISVGILSGASLADISVAAQAHPRTVSYIVNSLAREGIVVVESHACERVVRLADVPLTPLLLPLLRKLATPQMMRAAEFVRQRTTERTHAQGTPPGIPLPIGTEAQAAVLWALATTDALTTAALSRRTQRSRNVVRTVLDALAEASLVNTVTVGAGPERARWARLNEGHPVAVAVRAYALGTEKPNRKSDALPPRTLAARRSVRSRALPGSSLRAAIFSLAHQRQQVTVKDLASTLGLKFWGPIRAHAQSLADAGLVEYGVVNGVPTVRAPHDASSKARTTLAREIARFNDASKFIAESWGCRRRGTICH